MPWILYYHLAQLSTLLQMTVFNAVSRVPVSVAQCALNTFFALFAASFCAANVDSVDPGRLDQLERRLMEAEHEAEKAKLDERLEELRTACQQPQALMRDYKAQIEQLKRDVANAKDISDSLPDRGFRRIKLEP
ncbi:hypothetical protein HPB49_007535 [Dermacentor silvarum]|uniref:Uncharacterized protein n=1 Tax=Dermacentor silvarum TaxID=543639 RepID=A0ACB8DXE9_DERSI|nr:hypothetical protein HPB49_007535 [Dermacentor silvarum]